MAKVKTTGTLGMVLLGLGAIAFVTNPGEAEYKRYANQTLKTHLKNKVCPQAKQELGAWAEGQCNLLVDAASPYLTEVVARQTQRQNFLLFSIYQADLSLPDPLPAYHIETIGILGNYYTYQAQEL